MVVMSHKGQLLVVTVFALAVVASGQAQEKRKTIHPTTVCHDLIVRVSEIRFDKPTGSTTEQMEQALSRENEAYGLKHQLDRCVMETPVLLSAKDWQLAVLAETSLQEEFDQAKAAFEVQQERDMAQVNYEVFHERNQQWQKDYADLVQKYNALVDRCASIPTPPKPLVCTTTNLGHGDSTIVCN
jgi:hypothetical protein